MEETEELFIYQIPQRLGSLYLIQPLEQFQAEILLAILEIMGELYIYIENINYVLIQSSNFIRNTIKIGNETQTGGNGGAIYYYSSGITF